MGAADMLLFTLLTMANMALFAHLHRRWQRRNRIERMTRSLRRALLLQAS